MIGLQNAGKTSLLRVLAVCVFAFSLRIRCRLAPPYKTSTNGQLPQGGEFTIE